MTESIDDDSNITLYHYDSSNGDLLSETDGAFTSVAETTTYTWSAGLLLTETDPRGLTTSYGYDSDRRLNQLRKARPSAMQHTTTTYDSLGQRPNHARTPGGLVTTTIFDARNELISQINPAGDRTTMLYDAAGLVTASIDALVHTTSMAYDQRGFLTSTTDPTLATYQDFYDANGNVV